MPRPAPLRLTASTEEGLEVMSAAVQDGLATAADIRYDRARRRFSLEMNRFMWECAGKRGPYFRARSALAFDGVLGVKSQRLPRQDDDEVLSLLSLVFEAADAPPEGRLILRFAGGVAIALDVECLDITLLDGDKIWPTRRKPDHDAPARDGAL